MDGSIERKLEDYLIALAAVAVAAIATALLWPLSEAAPLAFFYAAVAAAAWRGGVGPALAAMLGSALVGDYFFLPPQGWFQLGLRSASPIFVFLGVSALIGWMVAARRGPRRGEGTRHAWFENFVEHLAEGAAFVDAAGRIVHLNPIAERLTGWRLDEARGMPCNEVFRIVDERTRRRRDPAAEVLAAEGSGGPPADSILISRNGVEVPVSDAAAPMWEAPGRLSGIVMIIRDVPQRKRIREALRQIEEMNRKIIDNSDACIKLLDLDGRILMINEYGGRLLEMDDRDDWVGRDLTEGWPEESSETLRDAARRAARGERVRFEAFAPTVKGTPRWWEVSVAPILDAAGKPEKLLCIARDVTDRKRAEDALRAGEERYRALFNSINEGLCVVEMIHDDQGRPIDFRNLEINPAFKTLSGLDDVVGRTLRELNPDYSGPCLGIYDRVAKTGEPARYSNLEPELGGRWFDAFAFRLGGDDDRKVAILFTNITPVVLAERERGRLVRELENQRAQLARILENAPAFICVLRGPNHVFEMANAKYFETVGRRQLIGRPVAEAIPELQDLGLIEQLDRVYQTGEPFEAWEMVGCLDSKGDGERSEHFATFVYQALRDPDGAITGVFVHGVDITERKRVEDALRASERRYRALFNSIDEGFCVIEMIHDDQGRPIDLRYLETNPAFEAIAGLSNAAGRTLRELAPDFMDIEHWLEIYDRVAQTGEPVRFTNLQPALHERWFDLYAFRLDDDRKVAVLFRNITEIVRFVRERERLIRGLDTQRADLKRLVENAPAFICILRGPDHVYELVNAKYQELVGGRELIGRTVDEAVPELRSAGLMERLDRIYQTGEPFVGREIEVFFAPQDQGEPARRVINFVCQALRDPDGAISGLFVHGVDVTEMVEAAEAVKESEARFRQLADAMPQAVWTSRPDGTIDFYNHKWREYAGYSDGSITEGMLVKLTHPDDLEVAAAAWIEAFRVGEPFEVEIRLKRASDGEYRWHLSRALPIRDAQGEIVRWIGTNIDVHDLKLLSEKLRLADRRKDEFMATLAHELRNPLAPIRTGLQILGMKPDEEVMASTVEMMSRQLGHMTNLIDDLMDLARVGSGKINLRKARVTLQSIIESALEGSRQPIQDRGQELTTRLADEPIHLEADPTRIAQVVSNLLTNAAKYTDPGGRIEISAYQQGGEAVIRVKDTGIGLEPEMLEKVFEMFRQVGSSIASSQGGLGIGLTIVKRLVELHGGRIEARSEGLGRGSEFIVHLPIAVDVGERKSEPEPSRDQSAESGLHVLVVDDNRDSADTLAKVVSMAGHQVRVAYDGEEALAAAESDPPNLMLLDIGLPGLNGYEVAERIRRNPALRATNLVAVTGWGQAEDRRRSREAGFDLHFVKPVDLDLLQTLLESGVDAVKRKIGESPAENSLSNGSEPGAAAVPRQQGS